MDNGKSLPVEPLVSIIISSYNYGRFLKQCIDSALNQTYRKTEIIVVDDVSTDNSREIISSYGKRVIPILRATNAGGRATYNDSCRISRGEIILILDSDDMLLQTAVEKAVERFQHSDVVKVHWPLWEIDAFGRKTGRLDPCADLPEGDFHSEVIRNGPFDYAFPSTSGNAYSRSFLQQTLPIPSGGPYADAYLAMWALVSGTIKRVKDPQGFYRVHGQNNYGSKKFDLRLERELRHAEMCIQELLEFYAGFGVEVDEKAWRANSWNFKLIAAVEEIKTIVPVGEHFILADEDNWATGGSVAGRHSHSFPELNGQYGGPPINSAEAIGELDRQRQAGVNYAVFAWQTFWWFEYYPDLRKYLRTNFQCLAENDRILIFDLREIITIYENH